MRRVLIVIGVLAIAVAGAHAAMQSSAAVACPRLQTAPAIDGSVGRAEWSGAAAVGPFVLQGGGMPSLVTDAYIGFDDEALYLGARLSDPQPMQIQCGATARDGAVQADDSLTLMLDPGRDGEDVITLAVNSAGVEYDAIDGDTQPTVAWRSAVELADGGWAVEVAYLFGAGGPPEAGTPWGLNILRHAARFHERSSMTGGGMGTTSFATPPLRAEVSPIGDPWFGENTLPVSLTNLTAGEQTVKVNVRVTGATRRAHFFDVTKLTLAGGEARDLSVAYHVQRGGRCEVELSVQAIEGTTALTALRTPDMSFELPPLGRELDEALSHITDAYEAYARIPKDERPFAGASDLEMLLARWRYLDSELQQRARLTPDVMMALVNRAQALSEDAALMAQKLRVNSEE